jgi:hypothetical protein
MQLIGISAQISLRIPAGIYSGYYCTGSLVIESGSEYMFELVLTTSNAYGEDE